MRALVIEDDPHLRGQVTQAMYADEGFADVRITLVTPHSAPISRAVHIFHEAIPPCAP